MKLPFLKGLGGQPEAGFPQETYLAVDIGTEVLKIIMFRCDDQGVHILRTSRIFQQQHAMRSGVIQSLNTVIENCRLGLNEVTTGLEEQDMPRKVIMGIAGELVHGVSIVVNYDREDRSSKQVDRKEQQNIFNQVKESVFKEGTGELAAKYGLAAEDIDVLHISVTGAEIGGMQVDSLVGFSGKNVCLHFYASFAPKTYVEALRHVASNLGLELIGVVSQPFAMARAFGGSSEKDFSGVFVDIGGGTTDIALVQNGNVSDTQIFAFGGRVFTKRLARDMNLDYRHAEARKIKYSKGELDEKISSKVKRSLAKDLAIWVEGLRLGLASMEDVDQLPSYIYLCGGGSMLPDLRRTVAEFPWNKYLPFMRAPKALVVTPEKLDKIVDKQQLLKDPMDVTPAGLARFVWDRLKYPERHFVG